MSSMSAYVHPWQRLRTVFVVGTLLTLVVFPAFLPSASSVAHAAAAPSGTPSATQTNTPASANATPGKVYTIPHCVQPPNTVDHATFTDAQLITYGMPTRESFSTAAVFAQTVRAMKHRGCQYTIGTPAQQRGENYTTNEYWAGYYEFAGNWTEEITEWYLNGIADADCDSALAGVASNWGGIGGVTTRNLVQSGTDALCDDHANGVFYDMWIENLGDTSDPTQHIFVTPPNPGDLMESLVGGGHGCAYMAVNDVTTGTFFSDNYGPCPEKTYFECIEESDNLGLAQNGNAQYIYCEGYDADAKPAQWLVMGNPGSNYWNVTMVHNYTDAYPTDPPNNNGAGGFWVIWAGGHN